MKMGEYIKQLRESRGMSQEELGKLLGVQKAAVNKWETGRVSNIKRKHIEGLSIVFNVAPDELMCFGETDPPAPAGDNYQLVAIPDHLTAEEMAIIHAYRALNDDDKQFVLTTIQRLQK